MKKSFFIIGLFLISSTIFGSVTVKNYLHHSINLHTPIQTDTVDAIGKKLSKTTILKTEVNTSMKKGNIQTLTVNEGGKLVLPLNTTSDYALDMVGFNLWSERYISSKLTIETNRMVEVYLDGKKIKTKNTEEDNLTSESKIEVAVALEPMQVYHVTFKILSSKDNKTSAEISCNIDNKISNREIAVNTTTNDNRFYELRDNWLGTRIVAVALSPNGKYLLSTYSERHDTEAANVYKILTDAKSGKTIMPRLASNVNWMPKSNKLYYTVKSNDGVDVITIDPTTLQEEVMLHNIKSSDFMWSPNEDYLVYTIQEEAAKQTKPLIYHASIMDRVDGRSRTLLAKYDIATGTNQRITYGNHSSRMTSITRDGKKMLFATYKTDYAHRQAVKISLFQVDMNSFNIDTLLKDQWYLNDANYSPDGKEILLLAEPEAFDKIGLNCGSHKIANDYDIQAFILNIESKQIRPISKDFDPSLEFLSWNENGNIYFRAEEGMNQNLYAYNVAQNRWNKLASEADINRSFTIDTKGTIAAYTGMGLNYSTRGYIYDIKKNKSTMFADTKEAEYKNIQLGQHIDFSFIYSDKSFIDGFMCYPPNFDENKKYPMIVYYYGGTSPSQKWNEYYYGAHVFASRGYVVYVLNPSGTTGYGQEFSARHVNAWGKRTADEIIEATKLVCKEFKFIDSTKIGCIGASYGGFMTQYLQTRTDIFACAVSHAGISNVTSYWGEGFWGVGYNSIAAADSYPWNNAQLFCEQGSLFNADKINTPLLLVHGNKDTNVPIGESIQLYNALKVLGKTVEFVEIDGENHTLVKNLRKQQLWHNTIMAWFAKWLQDSPEWWDAQYPKVYTE